MIETTCSVCHRVVLAEHIDGEGRCCYCVGAPAQAEEAARPADSRGTLAPRPLKDGKA